MAEQHESERTAYLQQMEKDRGYILDFHKILADEDFEFLKRYDALMHSAYLNSETEIDSKTKELILIAVLVAVRSSGEHIRTHMLTAKQLGASKKEILELLEMCLPPVGLPAFMEGFEIWREVYEV